jgi:crossover junction endodeoxyribonuclease RusA
MAPPPLTLLEFTVLGIAQPQGSTRAFMPKGAEFPVVTHDNPRLHQWRDLVATEVSRTMQRQQLPLMLGPIALRVVFWLPRPASLPRRVVNHLKAPDLDKLLRAIGDALNGVVYRDDAQIVELLGRKAYAPLGAPPAAVITVGAAPTVAHPEPLSLFELESL